MNVIDSKLDDKSNSMSAEVKVELNKLKGIVQDLDLVETSEDLPFEMIEQLIRWRKYPAYFLLIGSFVKEYSNGNNNLTEIAKKYHFPGNWETALHSLETEGFIEYNDEDFSIPKQVKTKLEKWTEKNWSLILKLKSNYKNKEEDSVTDFERELGSKIKM